VKRELVRGEPVVRRVLTATMEELARVGYRALRVEDVAARAEVNKTTVYRRWPEKIGLVRDALALMASEKMAPPDTGALRGDLLAIGRSMTGVCCTTRGESIVRMLVAEGSDPEVADIKRSMRKLHGAAPAGVVSRAVDRGELPPGADPRMLLDVFIGAIHHKIFFMGEAPTDAFLESLADLLLLGALATSAAARRQASPAPARTAPPSPPCPAPPTPPPAAAPRPRSGSARRGPSGTRP
jgi:AcrR family transcriptional regulator